MRGLINMMVLTLRGEAGLAGWMGAEYCAGSLRFY
jgi:hypothetical protein